MAFEQQKLIPQSFGGQEENDWGKASGYQQKRHPGEREESESGWSLRLPLPSCDRWMGLGG